MPKTKKEELKIPFWKRTISLGYVSGLEKIFFAKHLSMMLKSGMIITDSLQIIQEETASYKFKKILGKVLESVKSGASLTESVGRFPKVFDPLFISLIRIGEESGTLEKTLGYLSEELQKDHDLKTKVRNASIYPAIVLSAAIFVGLTLAYFILPKLAKLFEAFTIQLPLSTRVILAFAHFMDRFGIIVILIVIFLPFLLRYLLKTSFIQPRWHYLLLKSPLVGEIVKRTNLSRLTRMLGILLKSGIPINDALEIVSGTTVNKIYQRNLVKITEDIKRGTALSASLPMVPYAFAFPVLVSRMVEIGEETGKLSHNLLYLADFYEKEIDETMKNLVTILEPILLICIGLVVAFVAIAIITPIYQLTGSIRAR